MLHGRCEETSYTKAINFAFASMKLILVGVDIVLQENIGLIVHLQEISGLQFRRR